MRDLLCHTSGLSYGFDKQGVDCPIDGLYNQVPTLEGAGSAGLCRFPEPRSPPTAPPRSAPTALPSSRCDVGP